ncbi:TPA: hypothetical protein L2Z84_005014 [Escherichia coli O25b:H4-ST131]|nr:hypothetical protein [Escherichia coli O25b:H4-ST131]
MSEKDQQSGTSWEAATVDGSVVERLNEYEQGFREERAEAKAKRESKAEIEEQVEVSNVTDPSRVYTPQERPQYEQPEAVAEQDAGDVPEVDEEVSRAARLQELRGQLGAPLEHEAQPVESGGRLGEIKQQLSGGNELER